jgi:hypothetical protein
MKKLFVFSLFVSLLFLTACVKQKGNETVPVRSGATIEETGISPTTSPEVSPIGNAGLANPASVNCQTQGGELKIVTRSDGGQYGVCYFEDNRQCEEWALMRGACPVGGLKITGYDNDQQIYCAITGGVVDMEKSTCTINGQICGSVEYYQGSCPTAN